MHRVFPACAYHGKSLTFLLWRNQILPCIFSSTGVPWDSSKGHRRSYFHLSEYACDFEMKRKWIKSIDLTLIGKFLGHFWDRFTHEYSVNHEYPLSFFKNRVVSYIVLLENSSNRQFENSGASHIPFYWKTHPNLIQMDDLSSKTAIMTPPNWNFEKKWMSFPVKRPVWRSRKWKFY